MNIQSEYFRKDILTLAAYINKECPIFPAPPQLPHYSEWDNDK